MVSKTWLVFVSTRTFAQPSFLSNWSRNTVEPRSFERLTGSWRNFQIRSKPRLLSTNSRLTLSVIRNEFSRPAGSFHSAIKLQARKVPCPTRGRPFVLHRITSEEKRVGHGASVVAHSS